MFFKNYEKKKKKYDINIIYNIKDVLTYITS